MAAVKCNAHRLWVLFMYMWPMYVYGESRYESITQGGREVCVGSAAPSLRE